MYDAQQIQELLRMIEEGNKGIGGLVKVTNFLCVACATSMSSSTRQDTPADAYNDTAAGLLVSSNLLRAGTW